MRKYRVRRCEGNQSTWLLARLREDGSESDSYGSWRTSYSIIDLILYSGHLRPERIEDVEIVANPAEIAVIHAAIKGLIGDIDAA